MMTKYGRNTGLIERIKLPDSRMSLETDLTEFFSMAGPTLFDQITAPNYSAVSNNGPIKQSAKRKNNACFLLTQFAKFYNRKFPETKKRCPSRLYQLYRPTYALNENKPENGLIYDESVKDGYGRIKGFGDRGLNSAEFPNSGVSLEDLDPTVKNIVIVGGGPVGLYMAGLIKMCDPELEVIIIEKRVSERTRKLERKEPIMLNLTKISGGCVNYMDELLRGLCPVLHKNMIKFDSTVPKLSFLEHALEIGNSWININYLEYKLAQFAQSVGVIVFHDEKMTSIEYLQQTYVNPNTLIVFDATGGRLVRSANINYRFPITRRNTLKTRPEQSFRSNSPGGTRNTGFNVKEGYLRPDQAVIRLSSGCLYAAIGDTYMRVDYKEGRNVLYGASVCFCIALILLQHLPPDESRP